MKIYLQLFLLGGGKSETVGLISENVVLYFISGAESTEVVAI